MEENKGNLYVLDERPDNGPTGTALDEWMEVNYLAQITRNIRIPMNTITGSVAIAKANPADRKKVDECLDKIERAGQELTRLVNEITDVSELLDRIMVLEETPFFVRKAVAQAVEEFIGTAKEKNITLRLFDDDVRHETLVGDMRRIRQIVGNLVSNAVKYTLPGGTVTVTVREGKALPRNASLFYFEIEDTGIGMNEEVMQMMYQPFRRGEDPRSSKEQGVGLGLPIVRWLVRMLAGDIVVESVPGKGTKFTVNLPIKNQAGQFPLSETREENPRMRSLIGKRMLVAEDNELNAEMVKELLQQHGVVVDVAENGIKVLNLLESREEYYYDCILMDVQMPVMNGYEATHKIRRSGRSDLRAIPIIAMTADAFSGDVRSAKNAGMDAHVAKPLVIDKLMEVFMHLIK